MTAGAPARRGGALATLAGILILWTTARVVFWEPPFPPASLSNSPEASAQPVAPRAPDSAAPINPAGPRLAPPARVIPQPLERALPEWRPRPLPEQLSPVQPNAFPDQTPLGRSPLTSRGFAAAGQLVAHALLLQAGYKTADTVAVRSYRGRPARDVNSLRLASIPLAAEEMQQSAGPSRWSFAAWALWRDDRSSPLLSGRPSYGRSQIGAVMRYRLSPASDQSLELHARASRALEGSLEQEAAFGISGRPLPAVPVRLAAEARVSETVSGTQVRGAGYVVTEIPPVDMPAGLNAELYAQAGYVSGDFATPFADGQLRITRQLADANEFRIEAGGGAWGGAQQNAGRLDIGPTAALAFRVGEIRGRVAADYRFRVAGNAEPSSGPALTLSAGF